MFDTEKKHSKANKVLGSRIIIGQLKLLWQNRTFVHRSVFSMKQYWYIMEKVKKFLFREPPQPLAYSVMLLVVRIVFGILFMSHGIAKWNAFIEATWNFPDPIGLGATISFWLVVLAEIACSFGFILGVLFRLCLIPMIFTMCIALFVIHAGDPLATKEPALMYLTVFVLMFFSGPGSISIDEILRRMIV